MCSCNLGCVASVNKLTSGRRLLEVEYEFELAVDPTIASDVDKNIADDTTTYGAAVKSAAEVESSNPATVDEVVTATTSKEPTKAPTPEPTMSWKSRFIFWLWLQQLFKNWFY